MIKYPLNIEQSKMIYDSCKALLQAKMCYNNVFQVVLEYHTKFATGEYRVAYGYMTVFESILCRHCFIINKSNEVIDPTIFVSSKSTEREYYAMKVFDDLNEYNQAIEKDNYYPALERYLSKDNNEAYKWARDKGLILTG